ncbi:multidrug effflux MFS transporter [Rhizobium sp. KVB221]|uniref:Bcr/CflA family efflux transporter n=1 Tax=Rhizobium setariae TaxID=2801340 RepID=A0A936YRE8_9HYPH|nr:multidrug effflux MFS transporter [Rhizobium setariae]MBL0371401.1 multidrug effflux MFS transporter [Rhizobium setariae]
MSTSPRTVSRPEFIAMMAAFMALNALAVDIMLPALPKMGEALQVAHENERQLVITSYLIGFGIAQLFFGPLADRFGRRKPLIAGVIIYIVAAGFAVIAPTFETLLALRFVQGIGAASTRVVAQSVVRDRFAGRSMAEVMSLIMMVFMVVPVFAPAVGQLLLFSGHWQLIFLFMAALAIVIGMWGYFRMDETLDPGKRRPLHPAVVAEGFRLVLSNRTAFFYGISSMFVMAALFGFIGTAQQIYVDIYGLGSSFPIAFGFVATMMAMSSFLNSRVVGALGMRRVAHAALLTFCTLSAVMLALASMEMLPFTPFMIVFTLIMFSFGLVGSNTMTLAMEPLGAVAGTASSVFGFMQTVGGALMGAMIGYAYDGTIVPVAAGFFFLALIAIGCVLVAEKGKLFGASTQYAVRK